MLPTYYFLHIPKTSGTSLAYRLNQQFPREEVCPARVVAELKLEHHINLKRYRMVSGHFGWDWQFELRQPVRVITMLRNPIEQFLSACWHAFCNRAASRWMRNLVKDGAEIVQFCMENDPYRRIFQDLHVRHLTGECNVNVTRDSVNRWSSLYPPKLEGQELIEAAFTNLQQCWYFGFQEKHQEALDIIFRLAGWPGPATMMRHMRGGEYRPKIQDLPSSLAQEVEQFCELDLALYEKAKSLYQERWS